MSHHVSSGQVRIVFFSQHGGSNSQLLPLGPLFSTMSAQGLLREYQGHIVPQSYNAGFVALSYVVSLVGAGSTLELINRRTGLRGLFNQYASPSTLSSLEPH